METLRLSLSLQTIFKHTRKLKKTCKKAIGCYERNY